MTVRKNASRTTLILLIAGIAAFVSACNESETSEVARSEEQARVTSPNGQFDAVLIRQDGGGAPGGWEWEAYIVARGKPVLTRFHDILYAGTLTSPKLVWVQEHLLEIHYNVAEIGRFRNLWSLSELQNVGSVGERDYLVEIRLAPSSQDFSLLTPNGDFRAKD